MKMRIALFVTTLALTAVVAGVILASTDEDWRDHQSKYYEDALGQASSDAVKDAIRASGLEIKQDRLVGFGEALRTDRCRSCHMAVDDPTFADGIQPLRTHPDIHGHSFNEFGCTICHEGQGRALDRYHAHGEDHHWPEPLLPAPYIEASCARCHPDPYLKETPHLRNGRALFEKYACSGCHTIRGISRGTLGPNLSDVGNRFRIDYLHESIEDPAANMPMTMMPKFEMPEQDRIDLVVFLKSRRGKTLVEDPMTLRTQTRQWKSQTPKPIEVTMEAGKAAVKNRSCTACHKIGNEDGGLAPDLSFLGLIRDAEYIERHLSDPRIDTPDSNMPNFWMHDTERAAIAKYLTSQREFDTPEGSAEQYAALCSRCHGEKGDGNGKAAPNLVPRPREFNNAKFFNWLPEERAITAIRDGVPGTAMPAFGKLVTEQQARALFAWIRATFIRAERSTKTRPRELPQSNPVPWSVESAERGRIVFEKRCYGCHGRFADGRGPNASEMLPRPRNLKNRAFMAQVDDLRLFESISYGIVGTGMPPWDYLPEQQRWDLVNFVRSVSKTGAAAERKDK